MTPEETARLLREQALGHKLTKLELFTLEFMKTLMLTEYKTNSVSKQARHSALLDEAYSLANYALDRLMEK